MIPTPPSRAIAMASRASVTVSMAALTMGMLIVMRRVNRVRVSVSAGKTEDLAGTNATSSKVSPTGKEGCSMSLLFRRRPEMRARSFLLDRLLLLQRGGFGLGHLGLLAQLQLPFVGRHELLHPEIGTVEHEDRASTVHPDAIGEVELSARVAEAAPRHDELAAAVELLNAEIGAIHDVDIAPGVVNRYAPGGIELPLAAALPAPLGQVATHLGIEPLDPVVVGVADVHDSFIVHGDAGGILEVRGGGAEHAPEVDEIPRVVEFLDPAVARVHDIHVAGLIAHEAERGRAEFSAMEEVGATAGLPPEIHTDIARGVEEDGIGRRRRDIPVPVLEPDIDGLFAVAGREGIGHRGAELADRLHVNPPRGRRRRRGGRLRNEVASDPRIHVVGRDRQNRVGEVRHERPMVDDHVGVLRRGQVDHRRRRLDDRRRRALRSLRADRCQHEIVAGAVGQPPVGVWRSHAFDAGRRLGSHARFGVIVEVVRRRARHVHPTEGHFGVARLGDQFDVDSGVAGYFISEAPTTPTASTPGWVNVEPVGKFGATVPYTLSPGDGKKTVYVWFKDGYGNISAPATNSILLNTSGYVCVNLWGKAGSGAHLLHGGEFGTPSFGLVCDQTGNVYVVDTGNCRVQKFDNAGNFVHLWGMFGTAPSNFQNPTGVAVDDKGVVYVCDTNNHRVQRFDAKMGSYLSKWGRQGGGEGQFNAPWGVAVDNTRGYVYVVDSANFRIQKFDRSGEFVMAWGSFGNADGQLYFARGIAVDESDGAVFIVDMGNHRVQKFDTSTNFLPQLLAKWGTKGQEPGQFWNPWGITVDRDGFLYVTDAGNHRIQKLDRDGNFETQWGGFGGSPGQFNFPYGIAVDRRGAIFVLDSSNFRVQQFMPADEGELQLREQAEVAGSESSALLEKKKLAQETEGTHLLSSPKQ